MANRALCLCLGILVLAPIGECRRTNTVQQSLAILNKTDTKDEIVNCKTLTVMTPEGKTMDVFRSRSTKQVAVKVAKALGAAALLTATIVASYYSAGLFDTFIAVNEAVPVNKVVWKAGKAVGFEYLGMYYKQSAIQTFGQTLTFLAGGAGFAGGALVTAAGRQIGFAVTELVENKAEQEDTKWLEGFDNKCELAYFDVKGAEGVTVEPTENAYSKADRTDGLMQLEGDSNKQAQAAMVKWCSFYFKHALFGGTHQPVPEVCKIVLRTDRRARLCSTNPEDLNIPDGTLTCAGIIQLSQEEQAFQMAMMQMGIMANMRDKVEREKMCAPEADMHLGTESTSEQNLCNGGRTIDRTCSGETKEQAAQGLHDVEVLKAAAMHDCLALQACELLRKDHDKLQGKTGWFFKRQKHSDMLDSVLKRCTGHSMLFGTNAVFGCTSGKNCPEDTPEMFLPLGFSESAAEAATERTSDCEADEPAEKDIRSGKCECIEGATFSASAKKCQCDTPAENSNKVSFMEMLPQKKCREKCEDGLVEVREGDATRCISNFVFKFAALNGETMAKGECEEGKLELKKGICITQEMVQGILDDVKDAQD